MKLASLYESAGKLDGGHRRIELANSIVRDLLAEYARLETYEAAYSPRFENESDDDQALEVLRSIDQMFTDWVAEAEPVYERIKQLPDSRHVVSKFDELRNALGGARARLEGSPEDELASVRRLRRGEGIRYASVGEFRHELRAQRRP